METLDTSDRELVEQLRSGSAQALGELFDRYADRIYTYCFRRKGVSCAGAVPRQADPRTTGAIASTRLDLVVALKSLEEDHPQQVEPLVLRLVHDLAYDDIAQRLGASRSGRSSRKSITDAGPSSASSRVPESALERALRHTTRV